MFPRNFARPVNRSRVMVPTYRNAAKSANPRRPSFVKPASLLAGDRLCPFATTPLQQEQRLSEYAFAEITQVVVVASGITMLVYGCGAVSTAQFLLVQCALLTTVFLVFGVKGIDWRRQFDLKDGKVLCLELVANGQCRMLLYFICIAVLGQCEIWVLSTRSDVEQVSAYRVAVRYYGLLLLGRHFRRSSCMAA